MPNGDDRNWARICAAVDGFRGRHGHWPTGIRLPPTYFENVVGHVLNPAGFALVSSVFEFIPDNDLAEDVAIIAVGEAGAEFRYGEEENAGRTPEPSTGAFFGDAILRKGLDCGLDSVTIKDAEGKVLWAGKGNLPAAPPHGGKKDRKSPRRRGKKDWPE
jgi:hypothetical protein